MALAAHVFDSSGLGPGAMIDFPHFEKRENWSQASEPTHFRWFSCSQVTLHELAVAFEVQQAVAAVVERDDGFLVPLLRLEREVDRTANRMARLRGGDQPFRLREDLARLERAELVHRARLDQPRVEQDEIGRAHV